MFKLIKHIFLSHTHIYTQFTEHYTCTYIYKYLVNIMTKLSFVCAHALVECGGHECWIPICNYSVIVKCPPSTQTD